jgi:transcriptional regulator with XRE-family HTH domain
MAAMTREAAQARVRRNIETLMSAKGVRTIRDLADRTGMNENTLSQKINGRNRVHIEDIIAIAEALSVDAGLLLATSLIAGVAPIEATGTDGGPTAATPNGLAASVVIPAHYT